MAVALGVVLTVVGGGLLGAPGLSGPATAGAKDDAPSASSSTTAPDRSESSKSTDKAGEKSTKKPKRHGPKLRPTVRGPSPHAGVPTRVVIPRLGVDSPVVPIAASDGVLLPPSDPQVLGWWNGGAEVGAAQGGALITGHTVSTGGGAFNDLGTLRTADRVNVSTDNGLIRYQVTGVRVYRKASLAADAQEVFRQSGPGRLVLVTCEDWNGSVYLSNSVVFAERI